jgi:hypothetical protein
MHCDVMQYVVNNCDVLLLCVALRYAVLINNNCNYYPVLYA